VGQTCRKIMNARNEIRRQTIRALVGTAETVIKSEIRMLNFSTIFLFLLKLMNKEFLYYVQFCFIKKLIRCHQQDNKKGKIINYVLKIAHTYI
jgi:hypothetical protein